MKRLSRLTLLALALVGSFACAPKHVEVYEPPTPTLGRTDIVDYAITLLGRPYRNGAKGPGAFDCSGFVHHVYERFDVMLPVSTDGLSRVGVQVSRNELTPGDLAIFRIKGEMHVGIMINALEFIHASTSRGVAIDSIDFPYWQNTLLYFRRVL